MKNRLLDFIINLVTFTVCLPMVIAIYLFYGEKAESGELIYAFPFTFPLSLLMWASIFFTSDLFYTLWTAH